MKRIGNVNEFGKLNRPKRALAMYVLSAVTAIAMPAQTFTTLWSFSGVTEPNAAPLVQATNGNFYGTM